MKTVFFRSQQVLILVFALVFLYQPQLSRAEDDGDLVQLFHPFPAHFNAAISGDLSITSAASNVFVSLLKMGEDGSFLPYLASSWGVSSNGMTHRFYLQEGTVFHDGWPVTSEDVAFSYRIFRQYHPLGEKMFGRVELVETPDAATFVMHLSQPDPALLIGLASPFLPILPAHIYGSGDIFKNPANIKAVGSGPFLVADYRAGEGFILQRFNRFLIPDRPCLNQIIGKNGSDFSAAITALNSGNAHLFTFLQNLDVSDSLSENNELRIESIDHENVGALNYLEFNLRKKTLKNQRVRQAIASAIDLEFINAAIYRDYTLALTGPLPLESRFYNDDVDLYPLDLNKAEQLLNQAGYPRTEDGTRFSTQLTWMPNPGGYEKQVASYIKSQLEKIGIKVELDPPQSYIDWYIQVSKWQHHMTLSRVIEGGDPIINLHPLFRSEHIRHRVGDNTAGISNELLDVLLGAAGRETDPEIRTGLYRQFQTLISEELPLYFMHETPFINIISTHLQNFPTKARNIIGPLDQVCVTKSGWSSKEGVENLR